MAFCNDCVHYDVCDYFVKIRTETLSDANCSEGCLFFQDKSKFIELPCSIGDTAYVVYYKRSACNSCSSYYDLGGTLFCDEDKELFPYIGCPKEDICKKHSLHIAEYKVDINWIVSNLNKFGKHIFITRAEAEKKLEELK